MWRRAWQRREMQSGHLKRIRMNSTAFRVYRQDEVSESERPIGATDYSICSFKGFMQARPFCIEFAIGQPDIQLFEFQFPEAQW